MWINLENIMLSKRSQTQKDKYCMTYIYDLYKMFRKGKSINTVDQGCSGLKGREERGMTLKGYKVLFGGDENVLN